MGRMSRFQHAWHINKAEASGSESRGGLESYYFTLQFFSNSEKTTERDILNLRTSVELQINPENNRDEEKKLSTR